MADLSARHWEVEIGPRLMVALVLAVFCALAMTLAVGATVERYVMAECVEVSGAD